MENYIDTNHLLSLFFFIAIASWGKSGKVEFNRVILLMISRKLKKAALFHQEPFVSFGPCSY
jgi:hypothetical protein